MRSSRLRKAISVIIPAVFLTVLFQGCNQGIGPTQPGAWTAPVSLRAVFQDRLVVPGESGHGNAHQGMATYSFKNTLPMPVKLVFPPIGYTPGGAIPVTPTCNNVKNMPEFCQGQQTIELTPNETRQFQSDYTVVLPASAKGSVRFPLAFVFGSPPGRPEEKNVLIGVVSCEVIELVEPKPTEDASSKRP